MDDDLTDRMCFVLGHASSAAVRAGHAAIGPDHLLAGLLEEGEGLACQALVALGADLAAVRKEADERVAAGAASDQGEAEGYTPEAAKVFEAGSARAKELGNEYFGTEHLLLGLLDAAGDGVRACPSLAALDADWLVAKVTVLKSQYAEAGQEAEEIPLPAEHGEHLAGPLRFYLRLHWAILSKGLDRADAVLYALGLAPGNRWALLRRKRLRAFLDGAALELKVSNRLAVAGLLFMASFSYWLDRKNTPLVNLIKDSPLGLALLLVALAFLGAHGLMTLDLRRRALAVWAARSGEAPKE